MRPGFGLLAVVAPIPASIARVASDLDRVSVDCTEPEKCEDLTPVPNGCGKWIYGVCAWYNAQCNCSGPPSQDDCIQYKAQN